VDARLIKRSPLRDIASLLLSLDEIAYEAAVEAAHRANAAPRAFANWAERWFVAMAAVLWHTYRARLQELAPSTGIVPDEPAEARLLLDLYTLQGRCLAVVAAQPRGADHVAQSVDALRRVIARL
jgi:predicted trehalose synthase